MSIIYDALKKVEAKFSSSGNISPEAKRDKKPKTSPKIYLVYLLVIGLGIFSANILYRLFTPSFKISSKDYKIPEKEESTKPQPQNIGSAQESPSPMQPSPPGESAPVLVLNGIFFSGDDAYTLINNRILKVGDDIEGLTVKKIELNQVELKSKDSTIKLSTEPK